MVVTELYGSHCVIESGCFLTKATFNTPGEVLRGVMTYDVTVVT